MTVALVAACWATGVDFRHQALVRGAAGFSIGFFIRQLIPHISASIRSINGLGAISGALLATGLATGFNPFGLQLVLASGLVVAASYNLSKLGGILAGPPLRWLGERSYSIYLIHHPLIVLFFRLVLYPNKAAEGYPMIIVILTHALIVACTIAGAGISYRWFEMPARNLVRHFFASRKRPCAIQVEPIP